MRRLISSAHRSINTLVGAKPATRFFMPGPIMKTRDDQPIQTLHLSDRDKAKLLWAIDQANQQDDVDNQRQLRVACTNNEAVLTLKYLDGRQTRLAMLARNFSRWGAALVHGRFIHSDSQCVLEIQSNNGTWHSIRGTVRHIRHIQGTIHELGIAFDEPIDLCEFVSFSSDEETQYLRELGDDIHEEEGSAVVQFSNRVLVVDDYSSDRKLLSHWLTQAGLTVTTTSDSRSAGVQVQEQAFDLLVIDYRLDTESGAELIRALRQGNFIAPIIGVSADESDAIKTEMLDAGASAFMKKPIDAEELRETAYELIGVDQYSDSEPIFSDLKHDTDMRPLIIEFTRGLASHIDELRDANAHNNYTTLEYISHRLKGAGDGYGFPAISERARELLESLNEDTAEIETIRQKASELISTLNRIKLS